MNIVEYYNHPYSLQDLSPCINMGIPDTTGLMLPEKDLAGNARIVYDTIDIGAYEAQIVTGVNSILTKPNFILFPNPCSRVLHVLLNQNETGFRVAIHDVTGKCVVSTKVRGREATLELQGLPTGVYVVELDGNKLKASVKLIMN